MKYMISALLLACSLGSARDAVATTQLVLYGDRTITLVGAYVQGAYIHFTPSYPGLEGCTSNTELWIDWTAQPNGKSMYATVLAAVLAGQRLSFGVSGCSTDGNPLVYRVDVVL